MNFEKHLDGIYRSSSPVVHRDEEYDQLSFDTLCTMQERHFWYLGRHRFLLEAYDRFAGSNASARSVVDLGGGVGGWLRYFSDQRASWGNEMALADSSNVALKMARKFLPASIDCYQIDLLDLAWREEWDSAFLLDVIEHLPDDLGAVKQASKALKPGGLLFVTTPALKFFWSDNDDMVKHQRRYDRSDFSLLAQGAGLELCDVRYFMFFLSPLYYLSRFSSVGIEKMTEEQQAELLRKTHKIPPPFVNWCLTKVFCSETPLGHRLRFPWGTSILGVFRKP